MKKPEKNVGKVLNKRKKKQKRKKGIEGEKGHQSKRTKRISPSPNRYRRCRLLQALHLLPLSWCCCWPNRRLSHPSPAPGSFSTMARASSSAAMSSSLPKNGTRTLTPAKLAFARAAVWQLRATTNCRG